jgi:hypothetical protein
VTFERAECFHGRLAFREAAPVVGAARGVAAELDDGHDVQDPVDTSVADSGESVAALVAGGCLERGGAVPRREVRRGAEPLDITDVADEPGGAGRADPVQVGQGAAVRADQLAQLLVRCPDLGVDRGQLLDELTGEIVAGASDDAGRWRRCAQQVTGLAAGEEFLGSAAGLVIGVGRSVNADRGGVDLVEFLREYVDVVGGHPEG